VAVGVVLPRVWTGLMTVVVDVVMAKAFNYVDGVGSREAVMCWGTMWTTLVVLARPSVYALEAVCLALILYSCFGTGENMVLMWVVSAVATAVGIHIRPTFLAFAALVPIQLNTLSYKEFFNWARALRGATVGVAVFFTITVAFAVVDSVYYGFLDIMLDDKPVTIDTFDLSQLAAMSLRGRFTSVPVNALLRLRYFQELKAAYSPALGQIFTSLPIILGPLSIVLAQDTYYGTKKTIKELTTEFKNVNSGAGLGAGARKKKKKKKVPNAARTRDEDVYAFVDIVQTSFLLSLLVDVVFAQDDAGIVSMLPIAVPTAMMLGDRVFGPLQIIWVTIAHFCYAVLGVVLFGLCLNGATARIAFDLATGTGLSSVIPAGADLVFHQTAMPPKHYLGRNPAKVTFTESNGTVDALFEALESKNYEADHVFVVAPLTVLFEDESSLDEITSMRGHLCAESPPSNADEIMTKNGLRIFKYQGRAERLANEEHTSTEVDDGDDEEREL